MAGGHANLRLYLIHLSGLPAATMLVVGTVQEQPAGVVEEAMPQTVVLRTDVPMPGTLEIGVWSMQAPTVTVRAYWYGAGGEDLAARATVEWSAWLGQHVEGFAPME